MKNKDAKSLADESGDRNETQKLKVEVEKKREQTIKLQQKIREFMWQ